MPGYPNDRHELDAVFRTRQTVRIVPAAPSREEIRTAAVRSEQRGITDVDDFVEVPALVSVSVAVDVGADAGAVGTGPACWAPLPSQPNARRQIGRRTAKRLFMCALSFGVVTALARLRNEPVTEDRLRCGREDLNLHGPCGPNGT
jgi:hypothetical protein